jgi:spermidine synthase
MTKLGKREFLEIPTPFGPRNSRILLLEPAGSCAPELGKRVWDGTYDKPFILDQGAWRFLHFDLDSVQSRMRRDNPDALCLSYTRKMMAFLLFNPQPRRILLLGLGGGSLAKFCYRRLPSATITALEIDPNVMALREEFHVPSDEERFRVLQGDGVEYVARRGPRKDVILVDACDREGVAPELAAAQFYLNARRRLTLGGVLVMNVCGDALERASHFARIRGAFGKHVIALPDREDGNLIVLAFRTDAALRNWERLERLAKTLKRRFGLSFPRYVRRMARSPRVTVLRSPHLST